MIIEEIIFKNLIYSYKSEYRNTYINQSSFFRRPSRIKIAATIKQIKSATEISINGAQGAILSKTMPPTKVKIIVPTAPKKNATPWRVPLISLLIFL